MNYLSNHQQDIINYVWQECFNVLIIWKCYEMDAHQTFTKVLSNPLA